MRILNFTVHQDRRFGDDCELWSEDDYKIVFSIRCCNNLIVEEVVELYDPSDEELETWAANKLRSLFEIQK